MRKKLFILVIAVAGVGLLAYFGYGLASGQMADTAIENSTSLASVRADRVEVLHFHGTQQCYSCKKVGELSFRTVKERFPNEWQDGTVRFLEVNGDLPENRETVVKFQATGSSLFLNAIAGETDHIHEETTVWRLISSEQKFMDYLEGQIRNLLEK